MAEKTKHQTGETVLIHRSEIKNAPYNPRKISKTNNAKLLDSIKTHSLVGPLVWNAKTGFLVSGHQRLTNIDTLEKSKDGDYLIEVTRVELSDEKERALNVMLNNKQAQGEWDMDLLQDVLADLHSNGLAFEEAGFNQFDLQMFGDGFLTSVVETQVEAELELSSQFDEIKYDSASHEAEFNSQRGKLSGTPEEHLSEESDEESDWSDSGDDQEYVDVEDSAETETKQPARPSLRPAIDPETGEKVWTQEQRDEFARKRALHNETTKHELQGDVIISLAFQTEDQLKRFIQLVGADEDSRIWNKPVIEAMFEITL